MSHLLFDQEEYKDLKWNIKEEAIEIRNEEEFISNKKKALMKRAQRERKAELKEINTEKREASERVKKFTTTKLLMYIILLNCLVIEIYSMWVMVKLSDLSALYSLIGAVIGESITYAIYCAKSFNETKEEERIKLERDKIFTDTDEETEESESEEESEESL